MNFGFAWVATGIAITAFIILYILRNHYFAFFALMTVLGIVLAFASIPPKLPLYLIDRECDYSAKILSVNEKSASTQCILEIDSCNGQPIAHLKAITYLLDYSPAIQTGCRIKMRATLSPINYENSIIPHEVDYEKTLKYQGIVCKASLKQSNGQGILRFGENINVTKSPDGFQFILNKTRNTIFNAIVNSPVNQKSASFLLAVILGDDLYLSPDMLEGFRATGISHILALSGLHVGIIASLISFLLLPFRVNQRFRIIQTVIMLIFVWAYTVIVGMGASVLRSSIMISVFALSNLMQRSSNPYNSLLVAVVIVLTLNPYSLFTPGFQMSFMAVLSILLFIRAIPSDFKKRVIISSIVQTLIVPMAAMLGTGLIGAYYFHSIPWLFLFSNIMTGILFPWIVSAGFILIALNICGINFQPLGNVLNTLIAFLDDSTSWFASFDAKSDNIFFNGWAILPAILGIIFLAFTLRKLFKADSIKYPLPSTLFLLVGLSSCFIISILIIFGYKERAPLSEMYIPSGSPSTVMIRVKEKVWVIPLDSDIDTLKLRHNYQKRFINYFKSRGCKDFEFASDSLSNNIFILRNNILIYKNVSFAIMNDEIDGICSKVNYAIVGKGFKGRAANIISCTNPDTVFFTKSYNGNSRKKLEREMNPIPTKTLGKNTLAF